MGRTETYHFPHSEGPSSRNQIHWNAYRGMDANSEEREQFVPSTPTTSVVSGSGGPVRLTPGWEDTSPPPFDDILKNTSVHNLRAPRDRAAAMSEERRAPLASVEDFSSIYYFSPRLSTKLTTFSTPLLCQKSEGDESIELVENNENVEIVAKYNAIRKLRPLAKVPVDRFKLVYLVLVIHGIGTLMPWNMFITAKSYFEDYKLNPENIGNETDYRGNFLPTIGFAAQIPNVFFNWLNIFVQMGGNLKIRIVWSIIIEAILFIGTVTLAMIDTFSVPAVFYYLTIASVVLINMAGGIYQSSIYGIAAKMGYAGAVVLGSNISGTFTSVISIGATYFAPSARTSAIYYFVTALFVLFLCFDSFFALPLNRFYRYHEAQSAKEEENRRQIGSQIGKIPRTPYLAIVRKCWPQLFNVFFVFFVTLSIFPAIHSDVQKSDNDFIISDTYYTLVLCFLTFNVFAMLGSMLPSLVMWPSPKYLWIPVVLRVGFIPFFLFCNYRPKSVVRILEVYITNDWAFWTGGALMGITSGYFSSLAMIYGPKSVESKDAPVAGMFGAACLITGIVVGVLFQYIPPIIISSFKFS